MSCFQYAEWKKAFRTGLEAHLLPEGGVVDRSKMLTYYVYAPLLKRSTPNPRTKPRPLNQF